MTRNEKTDAQLAYETDCQNKPTYPDGRRRKPWADLHEVARYSWERNTTPR